jgi:hypothetical protein
MCCLRKIKWSRLWLKMRRRCGPREQLEQDCRSVWICKVFFSYLMQKNLLLELPCIMWIRYVIFACQIQFCDGGRGKRNPLHCRSMHSYFQVCGFVPWLIGLLLENVSLFCLTDVCLNGKWEHWTMENHVVISNLDGCIRLWLNLVLDVII